MTSTTSTLQVTASTELMVNFRQAQLISPQKQFQAIQTEEGHALLFSIGTDDAFYLTEETPGSQTGWERTDLSSALSHVHGNSAIKAKTFAVSQNLQTGRIDIALAVTVDSKDYLYVSLNNQSVLHSITSQSVQWMAMPYDDSHYTGITVDIVNAYIAGTKQEQYIVVDISRKSFTPPSNFLERFYIDPQKSAGTYWNLMTMGGDLDEGASSCLGRKAGDRVDGIYNLGSINGKYELIYAPLYNPWNRNAPPTITRLKVPDGSSALAVYDRGDQATDLFVAADKELYYFAADNQKDGASGVLVVRNSLFDSLSKLFVYCVNDQYTVWGLNRRNEVFYVSCPKDRVTDPQAWSYPVPILTGTDQVSPYLNRLDCSNTFFAVAGSKLSKAEQSPQTGIWNFSSISLPAPAKDKSEPLSSYTTRIQATDADNQPVVNAMLYIKTNARVTVSINHLSYVLNGTPIPIPTDSLGSVTIIEETKDIVGLQLFVLDEDGHELISINPMDKPLAKLTALDTPDKLRSAVITNPDGTTKPFIDPSVATADLKQLAQANTNLSKAYTSLGSNRLLQARARGGLQQAGLTASIGDIVSVKGIGDAIVVELGDLFSFLESGVESIIHLVEDAATGLWNFVVEIGGQIYQGLLDCAEKIAGAVTWIYNAVKTAIEDVIKYLEFLFEWEDITRTKEVIKNLTKLSLQHEVDQIQTVKGMFDSQMQQLVKSINNWAGITDWKGLGSAAQAPLRESSTPVSGQSAPGNLLLSHFQNHAADITESNPPAPLNPPQSPIDILFTTLKKEGAVLDAFIDQIEKLAGEYSSLSLGDVLKRLVAIVADTVVESAQNVVDALFDIVYTLASSALQLLDTPIDIPVVSDILAYFGVKSFSLLDLFCWIAAVPVTVAYKIAKNEAPFPDNSYTNYLIHVQRYDELVSAFSGGGVKLLSNAEAGSTHAQPSDALVSFVEISAASHSVQANGLISMPQSTAQAVFVTGHTASGFFTLMSCFVSSFEAADESGENAFAIPSAILGILSAGTGGIAGVLVPKAPIENQTISWINKATTGTVILCKLIFSGPAQKKFGASTGIMNSLKAADGRATGAIVNSILVIPALVCTCWHFYELSQRPSSADRTAAILEETSNVTSYISRISYAVAVNDKEPESKAIAVGVMVVANVVTAGLQTAEAIAGA